MSGLFIPLTLRKDERVAVKAFYGCVGAFLLHFSRAFLHE